MNIGKIDDVQAVVKTMQDEVEAEMANMQKVADEVAALNVDTLMTDGEEGTALDFQQIKTKMHKDSATAFSQNEANAKKFIAAFKATVQRAAKAAKKKDSAKSDDIVLPPIVKIMIDKFIERHGMPFNVTEMDSVEVKPHPGIPCVYGLCDFRKDFFILKSVKKHDA